MEELEKQQTEIETPQENTVVEETVVETEVAEPELSPSVEKETVFLSPDEAIQEIEEKLCEECNNEPNWIDEGAFSAFLIKLIEILNNTQGLDFELVNMKKQIFDLIDTFENK